MEAGILMHSTFFSEGTSLEKSSIWKHVCMHFMETLVFRVITPPKYSATVLFINALLASALDI